MTGRRMDGSGCCQRCFLSSVRQACLPSDSKVTFRTCFKAGNVMNLSNPSSSSATTTSPPSSSSSLYPSSSFSLEREDLQRKRAMFYGTRTVDSIARSGYYVHLPVLVPYNPPSGIVLSLNIYVCAYIIQS